MNEPLLNVIPALIISFAIGYGLYWLSVPKNGVSTPVGMGRKWFGWIAFISTGLFFPKVLYLPFTRENLINNLAIWLIVGLIVYGAVAFVLGWAYGKFRFRNSPVPHGEQQQSTTSSLTPGSTEK